MRYGARSGEPDLLLSVWSSGTWAEPTTFRYELDLRVMPSPGPNGDRGLAVSLPLTSCNSQPSPACVSIAGTIIR